MITDPKKSTEKTRTNGAHVITDSPKNGGAVQAGDFARLFAPRRSRPRHRARTIASAFLALALLGTLGFVIKSAFFSGAVAFPAVVEPAQTTELDFQNIGAITAIDVYPGESVTAGQVIATQSTQLEQLRLAYDRSVLAIDQQGLAELQAATASQATANQLTSKSQATQRNLQIQLAQEQEAAAEALLRAAVTTQQQIEAQAAVSEAQIRLALAEAAQVTASSTATSPALAAAQAAIARDESQIAGDQLLIEQGALTAPQSGVIAVVSGSVGELAGPDGVISPISGSANVPVAPSFQLFPPAAQAPATKSSGLYSPLVVMYGMGNWEIVALVPQGQIEALRVGEWASVSIAGDSRTFQARVDRINLAPIVTNGAVSYDVLFGLTAPANGLAAGMAGNVVMEPAHH